MPPDIVKTKFVQDLAPNDRVTSFFLVQTKEVRFKKTSGEPYLSLVLSDRTGRIDAKMWDGVEEVTETFDTDDIVKVKAAVQLFRDRPQLIVQKLRRVEESEIDLGDYLPHTSYDVEELYGEVQGTIQRFENEHLKALLQTILDDEETVRRFKVAPAAKTLHHAVVGGLLEHVVSLLKMARLTASNYDYLDVELLQTGVVLHDLGKIEELSYGRSFNYTSEGQLLGHITIMMEKIDRACAALPEFPPRLKTLVKHLVLSHHGKYEFGSPKLPMFPEALALHYIDDLDSKLESMRAALDAEPGGETEWTSYNRSLERPILNTARYLAGSEKKPAAAPETAPTPTAAPPLPERRESRSLFGEQLQSALGEKSSE